jgi:hypothetical protein
MRALRENVLLLLVLSAASSLTATCEQAAARNLLRHAVQAQGGEQQLRSIRNVQWTLVGYRDEIEESERPRYS